MSAPEHSARTSTCEDPPQRDDPRGDLIVYTESSQSRSERATSRSTQRGSVGSAIVTSPPRRPPPPRRRLRRMAYAGAHRARAAHPQPRGRS